ncbi:OmcA/MtrC family decaheme c-type cytochrome [Colwellia sp. M166]|nr:OmcA/MtrC family decaheme c-type cytochrome [Colwellia sp. M166]
MMDLIMKNKNKWQLKELFASFALVFVLALSGCGGDGDTGAEGPAGAQGPVGEDGPAGQAPPATTSRQTAVMDSAITNATITEDGSLIVEFSIEDDVGVGYSALKSNQIRFTLAQLTPINAITGESSKWQSYINIIESAPTDPNNGSGTVDTVQATSETANASGGVFTNNNDGTYRYTFATNVLNVTSPVAVTHNANFTHRIAFQISGSGFPTMNRSFDWQPSTGTTTNITNREMVVEGTCNGCHGELALHGGGRVDTAYCVTCHNPGTVDANSGESVDFKVMIHKIHRGANLPSVVNGGEYAIWGYRDSKNDYSGTHIPQDIRNCTNCHDDSNTETPDAINWKSQPSIEACGSCHDDVDFATGTGHLAGAQADNSLCQGCHGVSGFSSIESNHTNVMANVASARSAIVTEAKAVRVNLNTGDIEVDVMVTLEGTPVAALRDISDIDTPAGAKFGKYKYGTDNGSITINWDNGTGFQLNDELIALNDCTADGTGLFTCAAPGLLSGITATDTIMVTSVGLFVCMNEKDGAVVRCDSPETAAMDVAQVDITPSIVFFKGDGTITTEAYNKIGADISACQSCHADNKFHNGATDLVQCKTCHNATRVGYRGLGDLKRHVHRLHSSLDKNALNDSNPEQIDHFPGNIDNCAQCHSDDQFDLPIKQNTRASIASSGNANVYVSPTAVVCGSCHLNVKLGLIDPSLPGLIDPAKGSIDAKGQALIDHMMQNGGIFGAATFTQANKVESCAVCHAIGAEFGVDKIHDIK